MPVGCGAASGAARLGAQRAPTSVARNRVQVSVSAVTCSRWGARLAHTSTSGYACSPVMADDESRRDDPSSPSPPRRRAVPDAQVMECCPSPLHQSVGQLMVRRNAARDSAKRARCEKTSLQGPVRINASAHAVPTQTLPYGLVAPAD